MDEPKDIPGYEGLYAVTRDGRVWSYPKVSVVGRNGGVTPRGGKWLTAQRQSQRTTHMRVYLYKDQKPFGMQLHRAVALAYIPNPDNLPDINHKDGNPQNNRVENLEWCDARMNAIHAYRMGLALPPRQAGELNSGAKLTAAKVLAIRQRYALGATCADLARAFGVSYGCMKNVVHRKNWKNI